jgi:hypothetical protein
VNAVCERQKDGSCGFTSTSQVAQCVANIKTPCKITGCSKQLCEARDFITVCTYLPKYDCYRGATCERQLDLTCAWTPTPELTACLARFP